MAGSDIVAWSWPADWSSDVVERLEWRTDVIPLADGAEQRIGVRIGARRSYEFRVAAHGADRRHLEAALWAWGARTWAVPLWHDATIMEFSEEAGSGFISVATAGLEFTAGGFALLLGNTSREAEAVEITYVAHKTIHLKDPLLRAWPEGTRVVPAMPGRLVDRTELPRFTGDAVTPAAFRFELLEPWHGTPATLPLYRGQPVLERAPNWQRGLSLELSRQLAELDATTGPWARQDMTGISQASQTHGWTLTSRSEVNQHRAMLAALRGRQVGVWVPTWTQDLLLAEPAASGSATLVVEWAGYTRFHAAGVGRRDLRIQLASGTVLYRRVVGAVELPGGRESLSIDAPPGVALSPGDVVAISYMALCRQASDAAEIAHWTHEVAQSTTTWQSFRNDL